MSLVIKVKNCPGCHKHVLDLSGLIFHCGKLYLEGRRLKVPTQAVKLLLLLIHRSGHWVASEDMIKILWPCAAMQPPAARGAIRTYVCVLRQILGYKVTIMPNWQGGYFLTFNENKP